MECRYLSFFFILCFQITNVMGLGNYMMARSFINQKEKSRLMIPDKVDNHR